MSYILIQLYHIRYTLNSALSAEFASWPTRSRRQSRTHFRLQITSSHVFLALFPSCVPKKIAGPKQNRSKNCYTYILTKTKLLNDFP